MHINSYENIFHIPLLSSFARRFLTALSENIKLYLQFLDSLSTNELIIASKKRRIQTLKTKNKTLAEICTHEQSLPNRNTKL